MSIFAKVICALLALPLLMAAPASAFTPGGRSAVTTGPVSAAVKVHRRAHTRDWHHHHNHRHVVHAPFTRVQTGRVKTGRLQTDRRVVVDAPFTHVTVGRRGRHIVAPFVDLWLPR